MLCSRHSPLTGVPDPALSTAVIWLSVKREFSMEPPRADYENIPLMASANGREDYPDAKRLKALEAENAKLKKMLAEAMLDNEALKVVARGKF